jgi:hypothetical protein
MADIIVFRAKETPDINYDEVQLLFSELGIKQGLIVFERVLFDISDKLCQLELAVHENDLEAAKRIANRLRVLCPQAGLECLSRISENLIEVITLENLDTIAPISNRMITLGEASLFQLATLSHALMDQ